MKIARIILTTSLLFSLRSTLFASSAKTSETSSESIQLERKNSFDPLRDGNGYFNGIKTRFLGYSPQQLADYTLDHCGEEYDGKQIRPGSNVASIQAWNDKIQTLEDAQQFITATQSVQDHISGLPYYKKAQGFIEADRQARIKQGLDEFIAINQTSKAQLRDYFTQILITRNTEKKAIHKKYADLKKAELKELNKHYQNQDQQLAQILESNKTKLIAVQQTHNSIHTSPKDQIIKMLFVSAHTTITPQNLGKIAVPYRYWTSKAPNSFAEAVKTNNQK